MTLVVSRVNRWRSYLRAQCFFIGYLNLFATAGDIIFNLIVLGTVSKGFQCDIDENDLSKLDWVWLDPILLAINIGTHGFYPYPLIEPNRNNVYVNYIAVKDQPRCYPGMFHVYAIDVFHFMINMIWFKFGMKFIAAVHQKHPKPLRTYFYLLAAKLVFHMLYFGNAPYFRNEAIQERYCLFLLADFILSTTFLLIIHEYIKELARERSSVEQPPPYIECLFYPKNSTTRPIKSKKEKETQAEIEEEKKIDLGTAAYII